MEKIIITGNIVRDCEKKTYKAGEATGTMTTFDVAVNSKTRSGQEHTNFYHVTAWNKLGEALAPYLTKGKKVTVIGRPSANAWIDKEGGARASLNVSVDELEFVASPASVTAPTPTATGGDRQYDNSAKDPYEEINLEDLPF